VTHTLRLHEFGALQINCSKMRVDILRYVQILKDHKKNPYLKGEDVEKYEKRIRKLWKRRSLCLDLYQMKKENKSKFHFSEGVEEKLKDKEQNKKDK